MAFLTGFLSGAKAEIDATFKALRTSLRPMEALSWVSVGARSGAVTGVAAAGSVFTFRNLAANPIIVRRIGVGLVLTTGFTVMQEVAFGLTVARAFTASDTGGTPIAITGSNAKMRTSLGTLTSVDCRIATTGALTNGTRTLDANNLGATGGWAPATTAGIFIATSSNSLLQHDAGDYPLVLAINEGFTIQNLVAMGAGGVGTVYVNFELAETTSY